MREHKVVKCERYGSESELMGIHFEVHKLKRFLWFRKWTPVKQSVVHGVYLENIPIRFDSLALAKKAAERMQANKPWTITREDVSLD